MEVMNWIAALPTLPTVDLVWMSLCVNVGIVLLSVSIYGLVHKVVSTKKRIDDFEPYTWSDFFIVIQTIVCNSAVFLAGVYLYKNGWLTIQQDATTVEIVVQVGVMVMAMDFLMYVFHRIAHAKYIYPIVHQKHHDHVRVNALSLFVLSPLEALGFGFFIIVVMMGYTFSYQSVIIYLTLNMLWGTIGHFNLNLFPAISKSKWSGWIGTATFHNKHHQTPNVNYGFYTTLWDKLARTYKAL